MSTAPTTHDTPNENAHRMGAIIKSNRLGSISKTSARRMQKPQPKFSRTRVKSKRKRPNRQNRRPPTLITTMVENKCAVRRRLFEAEQHVQQKIMRMRICEDQEQRIQQRSNREQACERQSRVNWTNKRADQHERNEEKRMQHRE